MGMELCWNDIDRGNPNNLEKKPVSEPLCPLQIQHGLAWDQTCVQSNGTVLGAA